MTRTETPAESWWTVAEFARVMRLHPNQVYKLLAGGEVRGAERIGKSWRINQATWRGPHTTEPVPAATTAGTGSEGDTR